VLRDGRSRGAEGLARAITDSVTAFRGPTDPADDLAMLVVERLERA
jgi:hypothetical protein